MTAKYFALLTTLGAAKLANMAALGTKLQITQMAVGDGNGTLPTPNPSQTALVSEKRRAAINTLSVDAANSSQIIAEQIIPENEGGFWIREIGLFDSNGTLIAVANCPETYKPLLQEGSGRTQTVRMILIVNSTDTVTLKVDPSVVLATRQYVDDQNTQVSKHLDELVAQHVSDPNPHPQYAFRESPQFTGVPTAPTAAEGNNSTQLATTAYVRKALSALVDGSPDALDTLNELAAALGDDPNFSTTMLNKVAEKMAKEQNGADIVDVEKFRGNLGLGDAAVKTVGTGINQIPDMSSYGFLKAGNGYQKFPSGLILQWASGVCDANGIMTVSLPTAFKSQMCGGVANEANPTGWSPTNVTVWGFDLSGSTVTTAVARVRNVLSSGGPTTQNGLSGRILVWGY